MTPEWKIIVLGSEGVGKTSLALRYVTGRFPAAHPLTLSLPIDSKSVSLGNLEATLQIWDTGPYRALETVPGGYYVGTRGLILVYDMTRLDTFESMVPWKRAVDDHLMAERSRLTYPCVLVANKSDLADRREVTVEDGIRLAETLGADYAETSAKMNTNVSLVFETVAEAIAKIEAAMSGTYDWFRVRDSKTGTTHHAYRDKSADEYRTECGLTARAELERNIRQPNEETWTIVDRATELTCKRCLLFISKHWPIDEQPRGSDL